MTQPDAVKQAIAVALALNVCAQRFYLTGMAGALSRRLNAGKPVRRLSFWKRVRAEYKSLQHTPTGRGRSGNQSIGETR